MEKLSISLIYSKQTKENSLRFKSKTLAQVLKIQTEIKYSSSSAKLKTTKDLIKMVSVQDSSSSKRLSINSVEKLTLNLSIKKDLFLHLPLNLMIANLIIKVPLLMKFKHLSTIGNHMDFKDQQITSSKLKKH